MSVIPQKLWLVFSLTKNIGTYEENKENRTFFIKQFWKSRALNYKTIGISQVIVMLFSFDFKKISFYSQSEVKLLRSSMVNEGGTLP